MRTFLKEMRKRYRKENKSTFKTEDAERIIEFSKKTKRVKVDYCESKKS